jgi:hypothetical protein
MTPASAPAPLFRKERRRFYWTSGWTALAFLCTAADHALFWWLNRQMMKAMTSVGSIEPLEFSEKLVDQLLFCSLMIRGVWLVAFAGLAVSLVLWLLAVRARRRSSFFAPTGPYDP